MGEITAVGLSRLPPTPRSLAQSYLQCGELPLTDDPKVSWGPGGFYSVFWEGKQAERLFDILLQEKEHSTLLVHDHGIHVVSASSVNPLRLVCCNYYRPRWLQGLLAGASVCLRAWPAVLQWTDFMSKWCSVGSGLSSTEKVHPPFPIALLTRKGKDLTFMALEILSWEKCLFPSLQESLLPSVKAGLDPGAIQWSSLPWEMGTDHGSVVTRQQGLDGKIRKYQEPNSVCFINVHRVVSPRETPFVPLENILMNVYTSSFLFPFT